MATKFIPPETCPLQLKHKKFVIQDPTLAIRACLQETELEPTLVHSLQRLVTTFEWNQSFQVQVDPLTTLSKKKRKGGSKWAS